MEGTALLLRLDPASHLNYLSKFIFVDMRGGQLSFARDLANDYRRDLA